MEDQEVTETAGLVTVTEEQLVAGAVEEEDAGGVTDGGLIVGEEGETGADVLGVVEEGVSEDGVVVEGGIAELEEDVGVTEDQVGEDVGEGGMTLEEQLAVVTGEVR